MYKPVRNTTKISNTDCNHKDKLKHYAIIPDPTNKIYDNENQQKLIINKANKHYTYHESTKNDK